MSEETRFIPYELAARIVGNIVEEEHVHEDNRRIFTVYDKNGRELCWFDWASTIAEAKPATVEGAKDLIMRSIPEWAVDDLLAAVKK
ncbi:MAG: hypothetical protein AB1634_14855 [Thermodesulfobacteriota bacterium]